MEEADQKAEEEYKLFNPTQKIDSDFDNRFVDYSMTNKCNMEASIKRKEDYINPDRIDIHCEIQAVPFAELSQMQPGEPSSVIRERVIKARNIQTERFSTLPKRPNDGSPNTPSSRIHCNAMMTERMLHEFAEPDAASLDMLRMAMERLKLSARAYSRILKVARTIADL